MFTETGSSDRFNGLRFGVNGELADGFSRLAAGPSSAILSRYELDRDNRALAAIACGSTAANPLGTHSPSGRFIDGFRAGTG